ncbi:hypothetical protein O6H91_Y010300 [Diphasiastrum complanatum]|nr:hypothetical protein O6H91_Y010300 [Diphasiastrum complanatum]
MALPYAEQRTGKPAETQTQRRSSWKSFQTSIKKYLQKMSPIQFLSMVTECYIYSVTATAKHVPDGSLILGQHMMYARQPNGSWLGWHREEDDPFRKPILLGKMDGSLTRSASYAGTTNKIDSSTLGRNIVHASVYGRASDLNRRALLYFPKPRSQLHTKSDKESTSLCFHE